MHSLSPIQVRVLVALAQLEPPWTLSGGGALIGFHLGHRQTRDVDLFFLGLPSLDRIPEDAMAALRADGLSVQILQRSPSFCRLRADWEGEVLVVDLVAEPIPNVHPPEVRTLSTAQIRVDTRAELLVNKLAALYSRSELRDLIDVQALSAAGEDLEQALLDVPRKDGGFSRADLAWVLRGFPIEGLARREGLDPAPLVHFRDELVDRLLR